MKSVAWVAAAAVALAAASPASAGGQVRFHWSFPTVHHGPHPARAHPERDGHHSKHAQGHVVHFAHGQAHSFTREQGFSHGHDQPWPHSHPAGSAHVYRYDYPGYPVYVWRPHSVFQSGGSTILIIR